MHFYRTVFALLLLVGCGAPGQDGGFSQTRSSAETNIYDWVMESYSEYGALPDPKVLAGCLQPNPDFRYGVSVQRVFAWYTSSNSDGPVFAARLRHQAIETCEEWAETNSTSCNCQIVDTNGTNQLDLSWAPPTTTKSTPSGDSGEQGAQAVQSTPAEGQDSGLNRGNVDGTRPGSGVLRRKDTQ
ncbi:MAG: hypothetical protein AAF674_06140 [Pseudomonadota bacterium]